MALRPMGPPMMSGMMGERSCDRESFLREKDEMRDIDREMERCSKRRRKAGYTKLDDLRYRREE